MGLDIYLRWKGQTKAEEDAQYTGFKTTGESGYLRSSYSSGGFNAWARRQLGVKGYYHIFDYSEKAEKPVPGATPDEDGYTDTGFWPDWTASRARCIEMIEQAQKLDNLFLVSPGANLGVFPETPEADDVLAHYREHMGSRTGSDWEAWSSRAGYFSKKPLPVVALVWAKGYGCTPEPVLVCDGGDESPHTFYLDALQHVLQFIAQGERKDGWLSWSG